MTDILEVGEKSKSSFPDGFVQSGRNIDIEIALRLSRAMWKAMGTNDLDLRDRLNGCLQEEIDGIILQHEIDRADDDDRGLAVAHLLEQYRLEAG